MFQVLGFLAEGFVFSYLGLTFFSYRGNSFSPDLFYLVICTLAAGRFFSTFLLIGMLKICGYEKNSPSPINFRELFYLWYSGLIRGAISFGLVLRIPAAIDVGGVITTTCLAVVVSTTIIFGSTAGLVGKCLFYKASDDCETLSDDANSSIASQENLTNEDDYIRADKLNKRRSGCAKYFKKFDNEILKPILIRKFDKFLAK